MPPRSPPCAIVLYGSLLSSGAEITKQEGGTTQPQLWISKLVQEPWIPLGETANDLTPFIVMAALLLSAAILIRTLPIRWFSIILAGCVANVPLVLANVAGANVAQAGDDTIMWPMFGGNVSRDGSTGVNFPTGDIGLLWVSPKPEVAYQYQMGQTGSSAIIIRVGEQDLVIAGSYDRSVYGYDAFTGREVWRYTTGDMVIATPCYAVVNGEPMLFVASSDRVIYALNPLTGRDRDSQGRQLWRYEVYPWADTVMPAETGDPMVVEIDGRAVLFLTVWINDLKGGDNVQESALFAFDAATGEVIWKKKIGTAAASAPAFGKAQDRDAIFVVHEAGAVYAFCARTGNALWEKPFVSEDEIHGGVSYAEIEGKRLLYVGGRLFNIFCIDADTGGRVWRYRTGTWVDSVLALSSYDGRIYVFAEGGRDVNIGPPATALFDALGGKVFGSIFAAIILGVIAYNVVRLAKRKAQQTEKQTFLP